MRPLERVHASTSGGTHPEAVMPSHPTLVAMRRDPNRPRVRRQPVVRAAGDDILCDIERALAMEDDRRRTAAESDE